MVPFKIGWVSLIRLIDIKNVFGIETKWSQQRAVFISSSLYSGTLLDYLYSFDRCIIHLPDDEQQDAQWTTETLNEIVDSSEEFKGSVCGPNVVQGTVAFVSNQSNFILKIVVFVLMLHFSLFLMNRLNKTESAIFISVILVQLHSRDRLFTRILSSNLEKM